MDRFVDTSGLMAIVGHRHAAHLVATGLHLLQERGVAGAALAVSDGETLRFRRISGPVDAGFDAAALEQLSAHRSPWDPSDPPELPSLQSIGQVFGRVDPEERIGEPLGGAGDEGMFLGHYRGGPLAIAVHGRFTNGNRLRRELIEAGAVFQGRSDAELLVHLVAASSQKTSVVNRLVDALWRVEGAYAVLVLTENHLVAVRDPWGFRPLVLGRLGDALLVVTEEGPIRFVGGEVRREVRPGEMIVCDGRAVQSIAPFPPKPLSVCTQEYLSLARGDASAFGRPLHPVRVALGERLAAESPCPEAELVCGLPGGGEAVALGFARASGLPCEPALLKEELAQHLPELPERIADFGARLQWRVVPAVVDGRSVVLVVPSVGTGRLLRKLVRQLLDAGAAAVHVRVASPPAIAPCPYGVASPLEEELLFAEIEPGEARAAASLGAQSMATLSLAALHEVLGPTPSEPEDEAGTYLARRRHAPEEDAVSGLCDACLSGRRPLEPERTEDQLPLFGA